MEFIKSNDFKFNENLIDVYSKKFNLHKDVIKLLFARNHKTDEEIEAFLNPPESHFFDPFLLKDMDKIVNKINSAIRDNKRILILGDYDTDGISASAILYKYFKSINVNGDVFLPNRLVDGYGLTNETLDKVKGLYNPELIITVDCGISCHSEIEYCKSLGIDIIVTDHHDIPEITPNTLVLNPKLPGQDYPFTELCGAGVAFKLVQALAGLEVAKEYLTIASLATVADIVPLVSENRAIVHYGLKHQENLPKGLKELCKHLKIKLPITSQDIAFKLAPKINASGRMGDASISLKLYLAEDKKEISGIITELLTINDKRVEETNKIYESALEQLKDVNISKLGAIVLYSDVWESGVLGIICSKLVDKFHKPVCLLSLIDNEYKGSCRSIPGVNITEVLNDVKHLLIRFGGHNQAGGLSVEPGKLTEFCHSFNEVVLNKFGDSLLPEKKLYDLEITENVDMSFINDLSKLEPFGLSNESPVFKIDLKNTVVQRMSNYPNHLKFNAFNIELLGFSFGDNYFNFNSNCKKEILIDLYKETYNKYTQIKGKIKYANFGNLLTLKNKEITYANYVLQGKDEGSQKRNIVYLDKLNVYEKINELTKNAFGTLIVTYDFDSYKQCVANVNNIFNFELYSINDEKGLNTIVFAPESYKNFKNYSNVFYLDKPLNIYSINTTEKQKLFVVKHNIVKKVLANFSVNYSDFAEYHNAIKNTIKNNISAFNLQDYYAKLKELNPQLLKPKFYQFVFVSLVLSELKIIEKIGEVQFKYNEGVHTKLTNSNLYNKISNLKGVE